MVLSLYISRMVLPKIHQYLKITMAYGFVHAVPYAWNRKTSLYRGHGRKELLFVDKAGWIVTNTVAAPFWWPFLVREDLIRLECLARGKRISDYMLDNDDDA